MFHGDAARCRAPFVLRFTVSLRVRVLKYGFEPMNEGCLAIRNPPPTILDLMAI